MIYYPPVGVWKEDPKRRLLWATLQVLSQLDVPELPRGEVDVTRKGGPADRSRRSVERLRQVWESLVQNRVERRLQAEREAVLQAFRKLERPQADRLDAVIASFEGDWLDLLSDIYQDVGKAFANRTFKVFRRRVRRAPPETNEERVEQIAQDMARWIRRFGAQRVVDITETTRAKVKRAIANGVEAGESIDQIGERLDALYLDDIIPNRSTVIARTEVVQASNFAAHRTASESEIEGLKHVWLTSEDDRVRDAHVRANGQRRDIDKPFIVDGEKLMFPGDPSLGASAENTIQCRCVEIYEA